jgi:alanyl-tRNA synthetase
VTYLISDGVLPSNVGRGYIVRRLIRRVVMKGRLLGIQGLFLADVARTAVELSGACDPQVRACTTRASRAACARPQKLGHAAAPARRARARVHALPCPRLPSTRKVASNAQRVYDELTREEEAFTATLAKGQRLLDDLLASASAASEPSTSGSASASEDGVGGERRGRGRGRGGAGGGVLSGADAFLLYDSYGFPIELTVELAQARGIKVRRLRPS